ncbi:hypothetical protein RRG08_001509 [Elysia crispata]|uniref:Uncharacterized protein n=1 Tax=Elysia crispata TaxID=231223 RepID=A0AAE1DV52_9GAST|nr:hypothetical protein RRG08_001509 [Elysia crispata]
MTKKSRGENYVDLVKSFQELQRIILSSSEFPGDVYPPDNGQTVRIIYFQDRVGCSEWADGEEKRISRELFVLALTGQERALNAPVT